MSRYTTQVRWICEMNSGYSVQDLEALTYTPDQIIAASRANIFNFAYPIYNEEHRSELEKKILKHYYTREIGAETVGLWKLWLNDKMNLIMPKYNKLYALEESAVGKELYNIDVYFDGLKASQIIDALESVTTGSYTNTTDDDLVQSVIDVLDHNREGSYSDTRTDNLANSANSQKKIRFSDTPQGSITYADADSGDVYLTTYQREDETASGTNTGTQTTAGTNSDDIDSTNTQTTNSERDITVANTHTDTTNDSKNTDISEDTDNHEYGYRGSKTFSELLADYANNVLNIDLMIIEELQDLFLKIW